MFIKGLPSPDFVMGHVRERPHSRGVWLFFSSSWGQPLVHRPQSGIPPPLLAGSPGSADQEPEGCLLSHFLAVPPVHRQESEAFGGEGPCLKKVTLTLVLFSFLCSED